MLHFALEFCPTIDSMTTMHKLLPEEWRIVKELRNVLEVFHVHSSSVSLPTSFLKIFKDVDTFSHVEPPISQPLFQ